MKTCPRCNGYSLATCVDAYGEHGDCWLCGMQVEDMTSVPKWSPVEPTRDYLDPVATSRKISQAKSRWWRDPDKARAYNRAYKARRRAANR